MSINKRTRNMKNDITSRLEHIETNISILSQQLLILNDTLTDLETKFEIQSMQKVNHEKTI